MFNFKKRSFFKKINVCHSPAGFHFYASTIQGKTVNNFFGKKLLTIPCEFSNILRRHPIQQGKTINNFFLKKKKIIQTNKFTKGRMIINVTEIVTIY